MADLTFTGPSHLTAAQEAWCRGQLRAIPRDVVWRSGGAYGLDTLVVEEADRCRLYVPVGFRFNRGLLEHANVIEVVQVEGGYRPRNENLARGAGCLHAFLREAEFYRSGEWMTVNIARRLDVPVTQRVMPGA